MPYNPIEIDRENRTIMGVNFSSVDNFEAAVNAMGTVMFEGFDPTPRSVEIIRDWKAGCIPRQYNKFPLQRMPTQFCEGIHYLSEKITLEQLVQLTRDKAYA